MSLEAAQERHRTIGRNDDCPCGSGKKYKRCHQAEDDKLIVAELEKIAEAAKAEAAAAAAAEEAEAEGKTGSTKKGDASKKGVRSGHVSPWAAKPAGKSEKGEKAKNLPRRGAV